VAPLASRLQLRRTPRDEQTVLFVATLPAWVAATAVAKL
jgi:hypothetical protein